MADFTAGTAFGLGTGAALSPILAAAGVDPVAIGFGMIGAIVARTLLEDGVQRISLWRLFAVMTGSTLFAMVAAPFAYWWLSSGGLKPLHISIQAAVAAALGAFAPACVVVLRVAVVDYGPAVIRGIVKRFTGMSATPGDKE